MRYALDYRQTYVTENTSCAAQLAKSFTNDDNTPTFVPIGDLSEPHHSDCYRLFNFWREQKLRNYSIGEPFVFAGDWQTYQDEARALSSQAASIGQ